MIIGIAREARSEPREGKEKMEECGETSFAAHILCHLQHLRATKMTTYCRRQHYRREYKCEGDGEAKSAEKFTYREPMEDTKRTTKSVSSIIL